MRVQQQARGAELGGQYLDDEATQTENVRKMLLGFSRDLRVVLLRLASRLQTLRYYAASKRPVSPGIAREALTVFAPLANRSEEHTSELQSQSNLVCRLLLEKKKH